MRTNAFTILASLAAYAKASSDFIKLHTTNKAAWIKEASATLVLPELPQQVSGNVELWSGVMMEREASFLQGVTSNSPNGSHCNDDGQNWCNFSSTTTLGLTIGKAVTASPGSNVKTHYTFDPWTQLWHQKVYVNGKLTSDTPTSMLQHGEIFFVSIECASGPCAQVPAHKWEDIYIALNQADEDFKHWGPWPHGAKGGEMTSRDGGMTWNFTTLEVPAQKAQ